MNYDPNTGQPINNNYQQPVPQEKNTLAIVALVLAILGFNLISLIMGFVALGKSKKLNDGKGLSIAAIIISIIEIIGVILVVAFAAVFIRTAAPEVEKVITEAAKCSQAYECIQNSKSDYLCKYKGEDNKITEIKCNWEYIDYNSQVKTPTTTTKRIVTDTDPEATGNFMMPIEDVFTISGRGTEVTGRIERGSVKVGDEIQVIGLDREVITTKVIGIEMFRKSLDEAKEGDNAGILLEGVTRYQIERGQVIISPNSMKTYKKFDADIKVLTKEEGGRSTPFFTNYRPQFYFRTTDVTGVITLPDNVEMVSPGDNASVTVELVNSMAMEVGTEFAIREGGRTVAKGTVTKVY